MLSLRTRLIRAALDAFYYTRLHRLTEPMLGGLGAILMLHRVRPAEDGAFQPNAFLEVTPDFLDEVIGTLRQRGIAIIPLEEACRRIREGERGGERFAVITFDDGYRDNLEHAWPVLERHAAPFTIYVTSDFADGTGLLWWMALEAIIAANDSITLNARGGEHRLECATPEAKYKAYRTALALLSDGSAATAIGQLAARHGLDTAAQCRAACMGWDEIAMLAGNPLMTVGAHTRTHPMLARIGRAEAERDISEGRQRILARLGTDPVDLAYPHGGPNEAGIREFQMARELGFRSAVTTRPGVLHGEHSELMTALPRISVNGLFQHFRYLEVLLSGAPSTLKNGFRRVSTR